MRIKGLKTAMLAAVLVLTGCGSDKPKSVAPREFYGTETYTPPNGSALPPAGPPTGDTQPKTPQPQAEQSEEISEAVKHAVLGTPPEAPTSQPSIATTLPSSPFGPDPGTYLELGGVVMEVNGKPIYCNDVIRKNIDLFRQLARTKDREHFEVDVQALIQRGVEELRDRELNLAAAQRTLDSKDKQSAEMATTQWREQQINEAGGSPQLAIRRAQAEGKTLDELVEDHHREMLIIFYYQRKIYPRVQITPTDMRRYYQQHWKDETQNLASHPSAEVLILFKGMNMERTRQEVLNDMKGVREQAIKGADFQALIDAYSDSKSFSGHKEKGSSKLEKVEAAEFSVPVGQVSDIIEEANGFYLVKVIGRVEGAPPKDFSDPEVQQQIHQILENQQVQALHDAELINLRKDAVIRSSPEMYDACVALAVQNYSRWAGEKPISPTTIPSDR